MFPKRNTIAMCTLASQPRKPEHCVMYVMKGNGEGCWSTYAKAKVASGEWEAVNTNGDGRTYDTDNPKDMKVGG